MNKLETIIKYMDSDECLRELFERVEHTPEARIWLEEVYGDYSEQNNEESFEEGLLTAKDVL